MGDKNLNNKIKRQKENSDEKKGWKTTPETNESNNNKSGIINE